MNRSQAMSSINQSLSDGAARIVTSAVVPSREKLILTVVQARSGDQRALRDATLMMSRLAFKRAQTQYLAWCARLPESCSFDDIFQASLEGVLDAIRKYDESTGNAVTTVAEFCIRKNVQLCIYAHLSSWRINKEKLVVMDPSNPVNEQTMLSMSWNSEDADLVTSMLPLDEYDYDDEPQVAWINSLLKQVDERLPTMLHMNAQLGMNTAEIGLHYGLSGERIRYMIKEAREILWLQLDPIAAELLQPSDQQLQPEHATAAC